MTAAVGGEVRGDDEVGYRSPGRIRIIPLEPETLDPEVTTWLACKLGDVLSANVLVEDPISPASGWWASERAQLDSGAIVDTLIDRFPTQDAESPREWLLAITAADLTGGGRDYVFGEAAVGGAWAVIGTARFGAPWEERFRVRLLTEALHELGHVAGLEHCETPQCLMSSSRDVPELDRKGHVLCKRCREKTAPGGP